MCQNCTIECQNIVLNYTGVNGDSSPGGACMQSGLHGEGSGWKAPCTEGAVPIDTIKFDAMCVYPPYGCKIL